MKQTSDIFLSFVGLFVIVLIIFFSFKTHYQGLVISPFVTENATTTYTHMELSYPKSSVYELPEIFNAVQETKKQFLDDYGSLTQSEAQAAFVRRDSPYELYITTKIATSTNTVTYILETYEYTGGAHGGTNVQTFTYDKLGKLVVISDVLGFNYLQKISDMARQYLPKILGDYAQESMIEDGTEPKVENFNSWYITDKKITFIFGQYQVGPYVLGLTEFPIDKSSLSDLLTPTYK